MMQSRLLRVSLYSIFGIVFVSLFLSQIVVRYLLWPLVESKKDQITSLISEQFEINAHIGSIKTHWENFHPAFEIQNIHFEKKDSPEKLLDIPKITGVISWESLWDRQPLFEDLVAENISVKAQRNQDGVWSFAGIKSQPSGDNSSSLQWLLRVTKLDLKNIQVDLADDLVNNSDTDFTIESFSVENKKNNHHIHLNAFVRPTQGLLTISGEFQHQSFSDRADWRNWNGEFQWDIQKVNIANLLKITKSPIKSGSGEIKFTGHTQFSEGMLKHSEAQLNGSQINIQWLGNRSPLKLQRINLAIDQTSKDKTYLINTKTFQWQMLDDTKNQTYSLDDLGIKVTPTSNNQGIQLLEVVVPQLPLSESSLFIQGLPLPEKWISPMKALQPEGTIDQLHILWKIPQENALLKPLSKAHEELTFSGNLNRVGWQPWKDEIPGIKGVSGILKGSLDAGSLALDSQELLLQSESYFTETKVTVPPISGELYWQKKKSEWEFGSRHLQIKDSQNDLSAKFAYTTPNKGIKDHLDLDIDLVKIDAKKLLSLVPSYIAKSAMTYLKGAVLKGRLENSSLHIHGDTHNIPYSNKFPGEFKLDAHLKDASFRPILPDSTTKGEWLAFEKINADITMDNSLLNVSTPLGIYKNVQVKNVVAGMDLSESPNHLAVTGVANGALGDFIQYLSASPIGYPWQSQMKQLSFNGNAQLNLKIDHYFSQVEKTLLDAQVDLDKNQIRWGNHPPGMIQKGSLSFDEKGLKKADIVGSFLGGPVVIKSNPGHPEQIDLRGDIDSAQLQELLLVSQGLHQDTLKNALTGNLAIQGTILRNPNESSVLLNLDLKRTRIDLPQPMVKLAGESMEGVVKLTTNSTANHTTDWHMKLGNLLQITGQLRNKHIEKAAVIVGNATLNNVSTPVNIAFDMDTLQLDQWIERVSEVQSLNPAMFDQSKSENQEMSGQAPLTATLSGKTNQMIVLNRTFHKINLEGLQTNKDWVAKLNSPELEGELQWQTPNSQIPNGAVKAILTKLQIPEPNKEVHANTKSKSTTQDLPNMDISIKNLIFGTAEYSEVNFQAHQVNKHWNIDQMLIKNKNGILSGNGRWEMPSSNEAGKTFLMIDLETKNTGELISSISPKSKVLSGGAGTIHSEVNWQGSPIDFNTLTLNGEMSLEIKNGTILQVDPGAAKLLGILSLQSLFKFVTLNFKGSLGEAISSGTPFDKIQATANIRRGVINNKDFELQSTLARITSRGIINLNRETQDLRVTIYPRINFGSASLAALYFVTPIIGVTTMIGQYLFSTGVNKALQTDLLIQGSWQNPEVIPLDQSGKPIDPEVLQNIRRKALLNEPGKNNTSKSTPISPALPLPNTGP